MLPSRWLLILGLSVVLSCKPGNGVLVEETGESDTDTDLDTDTDTDSDADTDVSDADGDGYAVGEDCDDTNPAVHPGAAEACDGIDNDCDSAVDQADPDSTAPLWYADADDDGFGDDAATVRACERPDGFVAYAGDCDDADPDYHPGADEGDCTDPNDYNCDGFVGTTDNDGDGFGACRECDDGNAAVNPDADEVCNLLDDDCDGDIDSRDDSVTGESTWYQDSDSDGYGDPDEDRRECEAPEGYVASSADCDDDLSGVNPSAVEQCDGFDNDCDNLVDGDDPDATGSATWYADVDGDGFGDTAITQSSCSQPEGYVSSSGDCDDASSAVSPGRAEICANSVDDDCDGLVDSADPNAGSVWYVDADGDGYGDASGASVSACEQPSGYVANDNDCNDANRAVNPSADEICNSIDDDCDGDVDDDDDDVQDAPEWFRDDDGDGYGDPDTSRDQCEDPGGDWLADDSDCDDDDDEINPGAPEICDNDEDDDCDGDTDESDCEPG